MKIDLGMGRFAIVDADDFERLSKFKWGYLASRHKGLYYVRRRTRTKDTILMHREVLGITDPKIFVDHINGNPSDNRKCNLRAVSNHQNLANVGVTPKNKSGYKGVSYDKSRDAWEFGIKVNGKRYRGRRKTALEAAKAYDELVKKHIPEHGYLNFKEVA